AHAARIRERELVVLVGAGDALAVEPFGEGLDAGARVLWGPVAHAVLPVAREGQRTGARAGRRAVRWLPGGGVGQARAQGIALGVGHVTVRVEPGVREVAREHPAAAVHVVAHVVSVGVASTAAGVVVGALAIEDDHVVAPDHRRVLEEASVQVGAALAVQEVVPRGGGGPAAVRRAAVLRRGGVACATRAAAPAAAGDAVL